MILCQVVTPNSRGPWGEGNDVIELRQWNKIFREQDPVITPKGHAPTLSSPLLSRDSTPPNRLNFSSAAGAASEEEGKKCKLLGKRVGELTPESHARLLRINHTATEKVLAKNIDKMRQGIGDGHTEADDEAAAEERVRELLKKGRADLIREYVDLMHADEDDDEQDDIPEEADAFLGYDQEGWDASMPDDGDDDEDDDEMI